MIAPSVRNSKRLAFGGVLAAGFLFICLLAVKDMNDKLGVMTASNTGYQKMTDSQAEKIRVLSSELEALRATKVSELKASEEEKHRLQAHIEELQKKFNHLSQEKQDILSKIDALNDAKTFLESERDEVKRFSERQKHDAEQLAIQLRDQIARMSMDRDSCRRQYDALFKLHQEASDNVVNLNNDKQRLQLQLTDATSSTKSNKQLQMPGAGHELLKAKSSSAQPVGLEEPRLSHLSTSKGGSPANIAPVGAQPPIINGQAEVVLPHQLRKEDVMEAPRVIQSSHFENLDAQVDPIRQDHPGLQAPVYRDNQNVAFGEEDLEDTADGQIPHDYNNEKGVNQRYDHVDDFDYDFHADFQPQQRQLPRQKVFNHQPLVIHHGNPQQQHQQQQRYLAAPSGIVHPPQAYRRRGGGL